jgi:hypothetical protein
MLHLKKITEPVNETMESDFYVPIKVKFGNWNYSQEHPFYLEVGHTCLLELGFEKQTGAIGKIVLVSLKKIIVRKKTKNSNEIIEKKGLPQFSTKKWNNNDYYLKESRDFNLYLEDKSVVIELIPHNITSKIVNGRFAFGFDKDNLLCTIEFRNMTADELNLLDERYGSCKQLV